MERRIIALEVKDKEGTVLTEPCVSSLGWSFGRPIQRKVEPEANNSERKSVELYCWKPLGESEMGMEYLGLATPEQIGAAYAALQAVGALVNESEV